MKKVRKMNHQCKRYNYDDKNQRETTAKRKVVSYLLVGRIIVVESENCHAL